MARAREVPGFDCDEPFAAAAARVVEVRAAEVFEHSRGVLDLDDIERVHDMRVATRRLRAAMEVFEPCFPPKRWRKALRRVKALADALGERRDRDVAIEFLEGLAGELSGSDRERLQALIGVLRAEQRMANEELAAFVQAKRLAKLRRRLAKLVEAAES
ncbi:MAG TPA: CHAD domain-containing protein [Solirubrobacterales bacterium]